MAATTQLGREITGLKEDITIIRVSTAKTEQHLADLNGKVARHEFFINNSCPERQREFQDKIDAMKQDMTKVITKQNIASTLITTILTGLIMWYLTNGK